jgi:hypothetical protein
MKKSHIASHSTRRWFVSDRSSARSASRLNRLNATGAHMAIRAEWRAPTSSVSSALPAKKPGQLW